MTRRELEILAELVAKGWMGVFMSEVIRPKEFAKPVPLQPKLDMFGTAIRVGDAIVYGMGGVQSLVPLEVVGLTEKSIVAARLDYKARRSSLRYPERAAVLPYSATQAKELMSARSAEVNREKPPSPKHTGTMVHQMDEDGNWVSTWVPAE